MKYIRAFIYGGTVGLLITVFILEYQLKVIMREAVERGYAKWSENNQIEWVENE